GESDDPRLNPAGMPYQGAVRHRLPRLRQPADDLLAAAFRLRLRGALQRARHGGGVTAGVGVRGVDLRQAGGPAGSQLATPAMVGADGPCADVGVVFGAQLGIWTVSRAIRLEVALVGPLDRARGQAEAADVSGDFTQARHPH